jgi:hypothetical protein
MMGWLNDENLPNIIKQNIQKKKGGEKNTRWKDPSLHKKKKPPMKVDYKGNMNNSNIQNPSSCKEHIR